MTIAIEASCIVTGSFCSTRSSTFCLMRIDSPRSPVSTPLIQIDVLHRDRLIEPILLADLLDHLGVAVLARHDQRGIAGQQLLQREDQHRHEEQRRDELQQALGEEGEHWPPGCPPREGGWGPRGHDPTRPPLRAGTLRHGEG